MRCDSKFFVDYHFRCTFFIFNTEMNIFHCIIFVWIFEIAIIQFITQIVQLLFQNRYKKIHNAQLLYRFWGYISRRLPNFHFQTMRNGERTEIPISPDNYWSLTSPLWQLVTPSAIINAFYNIKKKKKKKKAFNLTLNNKIIWNGDSVHWAHLMIHFVFPFFVVFYTWIRVVVFSFFVLLLLFFFFFHFSFCFCGLFHKRNWQSTGISAFLSYQRFISFLQINKNE